MDQLLDLILKHRLWTLLAVILAALAMVPLLILLRHRRHRHHRQQSPVLLTLAVTTIIAILLSRQGGINKYTFGIHVSVVQKEVEQCL